nr:PREDICTED: uncharacterized protein LOC100142037 [Tribolium castaneum]|eukprot:XP_001807284.2 PREDICTED: uncharacterized protein LOC100142037 [Tribolium castaneum]
MKVFMCVLFLAPLLFLANSQLHYIPAQILIPALNVSTVQIAHNATLNNRTENKNHTGWNNPRLNKTGVDFLNGTNSNGDLIVGKISTMDHRLFRQVYMKPRNWWSMGEKFVQYPHDLPGSYGRHETISAVRAFNQFYDGMDTKAEIVSGGVGKKFVKIRLTSGWGQGFKYLVVIYGH